MGRLSGRRTAVVLLCEDRQHAVFARRVLKKLGWTPQQIREVRSPDALGSGEQFVRVQFPIELKEYRQVSQRRRTALIVITDADTRSVEGRMTELKDECAARGVEFRRPGEHVALVIPKRNIESWLHFLRANEVDERVEYAKLSRQRECEDQAKALSEMCGAGQLPANAPPSLIQACKEYRERIYS